MSTKKQKVDRGGTESTEAVGPSDADFGLPSIGVEVHLPVKNGLVGTALESTPKAKSVVEVSTVELTLKLPVSSGDVGGYTPRRVDARITRAQSQTLLRLAAGLDSVDARLATGRHVAGNCRGHAVLWLLDRIEEALRDAATA